MLGELGGKIQNMIPDSHRYLFTLNPYLSTNVKKHLCLNN